MTGRPGHMDMRRLVLDTPAQLATAYELDVPDMAPADHIVLVGMGGSAMAAHAAAAAVDQAEVVVSVHQGYGLPTWAAATGATVVACSYSGNTEETLDAVLAAQMAGLPCAVVTSGGTLAATDGSLVVRVPPDIQPRAALGYQCAALVRVLGALGAAHGWQGAVDDAVAVLDQLIGDGDGAAVGLGSDLADAMQHAVPIIAGGRGVAATAAVRWSTQLAENAKRIAFAAELPEMNHNLLEALLATTAEPAKLGLIALRDPAGLPRIDKRLDHTLSRLGAKVKSLGEVRAHGSTPLARLFSLVIVGDLASVALAEMTGVDAVAVAELEDFKRALREDD